MGQGLLGAKWRQINERHWLRGCTVNPTGSDGQGKWYKGWAFVLLRWCITSNTDLLFKTSATCLLTTSMWSRVGSLNQRVMRTRLCVCVYTTLSGSTGDIEDTMQVQRSLSLAEFIRPYPLLLSSLGALLGLWKLGQSVFNARKRNIPGSLRVGDLTQGFGSLKMVVNWRSRFWNGLQGILLEL